MAGVWRKQYDDNTDNNTLEHYVDKVDISSDLLVRHREYMREPRSRAKLQKFCQISSRDYFRNKGLNPLIESKKIKLTIQDKPTSSKQRYMWNYETWLDHLTYDCRKKWSGQVG